MAGRKAQKRKTKGRKAKQQRATELMKRVRNDIRSAKHRGDFAMSEDGKTFEVRNADQLRRRIAPSLSELSMLASMAGAVSMHAAMGARRQGKRLAMETVANQLQSGGATIVSVDDGQHIMERLDRLSRNSTYGKTGALTSNWWTQGDVFTGEPRAHVQRVLILKGTREEFEGKLRELTIAAESIGEKSILGYSFEVVEVSQDVIDELKDVRAPAVIDIDTERDT